jgi:hypothetical protein
LVSSFPADVIISLRYIQTNNHRCHRSDQKEAFENEAMPFDVIKAKMIIITSSIANTTTANQCQLLV